MTVILNGEPRSFEDSITVRTLVEGLGLSCEKVAVERNRRLVRGNYDVPLSDGDQIEIVTFVGGG